MLSNPQRLARLAASLNLAERQEAFQEIPSLSGVEFLLFAHEVALRRGWGNGLKKAVGRWYAQFTPEQLREQMRGAEEEHAWVLRRAHVVPSTLVHNMLFAELLTKVQEIA